MLMLRQSLSLLVLLAAAWAAIALMTETGAHPIASGIVVGVIAAPIIGWLDPWDDERRWRR